METIFTQWTNDVGQFAFHMRKYTQVYQIIDDMEILTHDNHHHFKTVAMLALICIGAVFLRIRNIHEPIVDAHAWRQHDTYAIASNYLKNGYDFLRPQINEITPILNKDRLFFEEFPLYEYILSGVFTVFGHSLVVARVYTILLFICTAIALYFIGYYLFDRNIGISAAIWFTLFPGSIYWGRTVIPDALAVCLSTLSGVFIFSRFRAWHLTAALALSIAVLTKPFYVVLFVPYAYMWMQHHKRPKHWLLLLLIGAIVVILPFIFWRAFIAMQQRESIYSPAIQAFLWNGENPYAFLSRTRWIETLLFQRIPSLLSPLGGILFLYGVFASIRERYISSVRVWLFCIFFSFLIVAQGNLWHDYYQIILMPPAALLLAVVSRELYKRIVKFSAYYLLSIGLLAFVVIFLLYVPIREIYYFNSDVKFTIFADEMNLILENTNDNDKILLVDDRQGGSSLLLNQLGVVGWVDRSGELCNPTEMDARLTLYKSLGATILIVPQEPYLYNIDPYCDRSELTIYASHQFESILNGKYLTMYRL